MTFLFYYFLFFFLFFYNFLWLVLFLLSKESKHTLHHLEKHHFLTFRQSKSVLLTFFIFFFPKNPDGGPSSILSHPIKTLHLEDKATVWFLRIVLTNVPFVGHLTFKWYALLNSFSSQCFNSNQKLGNFILLLLIFVFILLVIIQNYQN